MTVLEVVLAYVQNHPELCDDRKKKYSKLVSQEGYAKGIANKFVDELTRRDLELVRVACRTGNKGKEITAQSINEYTSMLNASFHWGAEQELIQDNPWRKFRRLKVLSRGSRKATMEEFAEVYKILTPSMQWACRTCIALSVRPGEELLSIKWEAFNWKKGSVEIYMPKVKSWKTVFPPKQYMYDGGCRKS